MIVRNAQATLPRCLDSLQRHFLRESDELCILDTGSTDKTVEIAESYGANVHQADDLLEDMRPKVDAWCPEWMELFESDDNLKDGVIRSFAEARDRVTKLAKNDLQFWIDADDTLEEDISGQLREVIPQFFQNMDSLFLEYQYAFSTDGKLTTTLKRERVFDRTKQHWKGACHECLIPIEGADYRGAGWYKDLRSYIKHHRPAQTGVSRNCDLRNYLILRSAVEREEEEKQKADIRYYFYLANAARGLHLFEEATDLYQLTVKLSGSRDDIWASAYSIVQMKTRPEWMRPASALKWAYQCVELDEKDPRGYFALAHCNFLLHRFQESIHWFDIGRGMPEPRESLHAYDPEHIYTVPYIIASMAFKELGSPDQALQCCEVLRQRRPNDASIMGVVEDVENWANGQRLADAMKIVAANITKEGRRGLGDCLRFIGEEVNVIPVDLENNGVGKAEHLVVDESANQVDFFCGGTTEAWGPISASSGIGGSERAAIEMAYRLADRGFQVRVYCNCPAEERGEQDYRGFKSKVLWLHWSQFDREAHRQNLIFWRCPDMLDADLPADRKIVWCHDVQNPGTWTKNRVEKVDKVMVLSEYHKTTLGGKVPDDKIVISRNGIPSDLFRSALETETRDPGKVIFTSSPDRGALSAVRDFQECFGEKEDVSLHLFYGFSKIFMENAAQYPYRRVPDCDRDVNLLDYMRTLQDAVDDDSRIHWRGRVGWEDMAKEFASASVWLYPTRFPEISCISAMEAQAAGLAICSTRFAALDETIQADRFFCFDESQSIQTQAQRLWDAYAAKKLDRDSQSQKALETFNWDGVVDQWIGEVLECRVSIP
jgi:glycosyltransferase involved in cell wall biosynthesis